jgi:hypothetical protein
MTGDDPMPWDLKKAFEFAIAEYKAWRRHNAEEPTVTYDGMAEPISWICERMAPYEDVPLEPGIAKLLDGVADARHDARKNQLTDNYASAGQYLLALIEYRKARLQERNAQT